MSAAIIANCTKFVKEYMSKYDASHDFSHVLRVRNLAMHLASKYHKPVDLLEVELAALMHDVNDHKYDQDPDPDIIYNSVVKFGGSKLLASKIVYIVKHVSYSYEIKNAHLSTYILAMQIPEIKIVQDADRLESIGAVGIARCFMFNGANNELMLEALNHFDDKLLHVHKLMKTEYGKEVALERTERLKLFKKWIIEELN